MKYNREIHHRRSIRLPGYNYCRAGGYFATICAHDRECLFGEIVGDDMRLNDFGRLVTEEWLRSAKIRAEIVLGPHVVMPNHFHGIVIFVDDEVTARRDPMVEQFGKPVAGSLPTIVRAFKSAVTRSINLDRKTLGLPVWQKNYYEHIIRDDADFERIVEYIASNPKRWLNDTLNPDNAP